MGPGNSSISSSLLRIHENVAMKFDQKIRTANADVGLSRWLQVNAATRETMAHSQTQAIIEVTSQVNTDAHRHDHAVLYDSVGNSELMLKEM